MGKPEGCKDGCPPLQTCDFCAGGSDDLVKRLSCIGERIAIPCPDNIDGCLVSHFRIETNPVCQEAIDRIQALEAALQSIAANTCCDSCREAAKVARAALGEKKDG